MEEEKDAFYVVRKGDVIGVYKSFKDCQSQIASSICDPSVSVFKGYYLSKEAEEHLKSHGLRNATYTVSASDVKADTFGRLLPCPYQLPASSGKAQIMDSAPDIIKRTVQHNVVLPTSSGKPQVMESSLDKMKGTVQREIMGRTVQQEIVNSCTIEFDGASKGNPGQAGAGAVVRAANGVIYRLREGVGFATNNVAEYRALILGLTFALRKGFSDVSVYGDSQLVCRQIEGIYKTKNPNMASLCKEANELKVKFKSFKIQHVAREFNSEADAQANLAINLRAGEVEQDCYSQN